MDSVGEDSHPISIGQGAIFGRLLVRQQWVASVTTAWEREWDSGREIWGRSLHVGYPGMTGTSQPTNSSCGRLFLPWTRLFMLAGELWTRVFMALQVAGASW